MIHRFILLFVFEMFSRSHLVSMDAEKNMKEYVEKKTGVVWKRTKFPLYI